MRIFTPYPTPRDEAPVLRPPGRVRRGLPANFDPADLPPFEHELERELPATRLLELNDTRITPDGMLFKGWRLLTETFSSPVIMRHFLARRRSVVKFFVTNRLVRRRRRGALRRRRRRPAPPPRKPQTHARGRRRPLTGNRAPLLLL